METSSDGTLRHRVYAITSDRWSGGRAGFAFDLIIVTLIALSVAAIVLESVPAIGSEHSRSLRAFEVFVVVVFSAEYLLRLWSCTADPEYAHPIAGRLRFALKPMNLIDLCAILPFYLPLLGVDLRAARVFRLFRLLRLAKLGRYTSAMEMLGRVVVRVKYEIVTLALIVVCFVLISSTLMYYSERHVPESGFTSIPESLAWTVSNLTPVNISGANPMTTTGRGIAMIIGIVGLGVIALPTGIVGAGFVEELRSNRESNQAGEN